ncbi:Radical SAM domain protein [Arcobacter nitrofigilis DSM 7299]|uniref:Radical SAM domain protein n=1 Tax=Arcobacter nitrofigilis (strain ATCC 33309 / DSM 7299 / CCUG 15893 / LMG 7604 / NCTC 12251 / CI) TaxID=572480 RepID=D5V0V3_ARCNC|nr:radical SAM protein [Arcobacter nitrofigilis]ADG93915.1 Radical SAM domain protein [Arcobacter nitrofigilis DSM 7299]
MKNFKKVHIEITNICNLKCSFCPPKNLPNATMSLDKFEKINSELSSVTKELAYHVVGDPLVVSNLNQYLDISKNHGLKVNLTTTGYNLKEEQFESLCNSAIKQINFSINSYNGNSHKKSLDEYLTPIFDFCKYALEKEVEFFINLRIWNFDEEKSAKEFNKKVFEKAYEYFDLTLDIEQFYVAKPKNIRVARKIFFNFDDYFEWPSLENEFVSDKGFCYGLDSHFGILANGTAVPCCLDKDACVNLGNVFEDGLQNILTSKRVNDIKDGFKKGIVVEELCQKCSYRTRFDK